MDFDPEIRIRKAILDYTQAKIRMAERFRDGISPDDFAEFDRTLAEVNRILRNCEKNIAEELDPGEATKA